MTFIDNDIYVHLPASKIRCLTECWRPCQNCHAFISSSGLFSSRNISMTMLWKANVIKIDEKSDANDLRPLFDFRIKIFMRFYTVYCCNGIRLAGIIRFTCDWGPRSTLLAFFLVSRYIKLLTVILVTNQLNRFLLLLFFIIITRSLINTMWFVGVPLIYSKISWEYFQIVVWKLTTLKISNYIFKLQTPTWRQGYFN